MVSARVGESESVYHRDPYFFREFTRRDDDGTMGFDVYNTHTIVGAYFFCGGGHQRLSAMPPPSVATMTPKLHDVGTWM